ncbi:hypothetical protein M885DRAFT_23481 [Pelagophyceae sp. CCMP2097]|nr:hypothetical protein M885DRAFT_23481 [Pelagophyceae sp. CCMP2097]
MVKSSVVSVHQARDAALAEAELDRILDDAIADFEEEEDLSNAKVDEAASSGRAGTALSAEKGPKRIDKELEDKIRANALDDMEALVDNLNNPAFKETLEMTLQALSGHSDGVATIEDFMKGQRHRAENATPSHVPEVELDRTVAATMEALSKESADMVGMETAQVE